VAISPDGSRAWVPSKKDNILLGGNRDKKPLNFQNTVRPIVSLLDLSTGSVDGDIDINDSDSPSAVAFVPRGDLAFVATQGNNTLHIFNVYSKTSQVFSVGLAPQGLAVNAAGTRLYVQNFLSRTIGVYDISGITNFTTSQASLLNTVVTVTTEKLTPAVLAGKRIFFDSSSRRMTSDGYMSCASCHLDGGHDGRVWDFTDRGEGFRRTTDLRGRSGVGHGPVHWTANHDEIQDFEHDIRGTFAGSGFILWRLRQISGNPPSRGSRTLTKSRDLP
jgi:DNA-binding beta-propeller fold protein YncE